MSAPVISPAVSAAERCQHSVAEILRVHNIVSPAAGSGYTTCPQCSALRKPANQKKQVLHVTVDRDGVQWFCNHCQWFGGELFEPRAGQMHLVASYDYRSENGELLFQTLRFFPKDFRQRRPDGKGEWIWNLQGVRRVLYRLPELLAAKNADPKRPVFVVEGEKDADALQRGGATATCNPMGAGKWRDEYAEFLRGFEVVAVIADKDEPGRAHAQQVAASVAAVVKQVKVIELPGERVKDASDFIAAGGALQEIYDIAAATPDWVPAAPHGATAEVREQAAGDVRNGFTDHVVAKGKAQREEDRLVISKAADLEMRGVDWLWPGRFARGKFGLIAGLPDMGKGQIAAFLAAAVTAGIELPCREGSAPQGNVIWFNAEDDARDTVLPRLIAAGADPKRVHFVNGTRVGGEDKIFSLVTDLQLLCKAINRIGNVVLVIIDPVSAYLGVGKVDGRSATDVRGFLHRSRTWPRSCTLP
jgi:putative DNA primase/helicase